MLGKKKLFGSTVPPACTYCAFSRPASDKRMLLCRKCGVVSPYYKCKKYEYDPLKRVPRRPPALPTFTADDFKLD